MITDLAPAANKLLPIEQQLDPVIVCATDDAYIMPLAVTLYSAAENLRAGRSLRVFLLDGGVSDQNKMKLKESLVDLPISYQWIQFDDSVLKQFQVSHHVSHTAYFRLLLADVLPENCEKVIYLDCDLLIKGDLQELWEMPMQGNALLAVQDVACPYVDCRIGIKNFRRSNPYLATFQPIPNYRELKIDPKAKYFNSGVLVIDLNQWRDLGLSAEFLQCLSENEEHIWCWDQYALNVVLAGRWQSLPLCWNSGSHVYEYPSERHSPVDETEFEQMINDPKVVHFTTEWKPWHFGIDHAFRQDFFAVLDRTQWKDWRPIRPRFNWRRTVQGMIVGAIKRGTIIGRKWATLMGRV